MSKKQAIALSVLTVLIVLSYFVFNFTDISITGKATSNTRLVVIEKIPTVCNRSFEEGWNLVSFPCLSSDENVTAFFDESLFFNVTPLSYDSLMLYDPNRVNDPWRSYHPDLPSWVIHDLSKISRSYGYWIDVGNETLFYRESDLATPTLIDLVAGWNMIGYPQVNATLINNTYNQLIPNFDYVYLYNASDSDWKEWTWNTTAYPSTQDLEYSHPYYGNWIYLFIDDTIIIG